MGSGPISLQRAVVARHDGCTRLRMPGKNISRPGPKGVSTTNRLWTLSTEPIRVGSRAHKRGEGKQTMGTERPKELEESIASAGWEIDDGFSGHLLIGDDSNNNLSVVAYLDGWHDDDPLFELLDHERPTGSGKYVPLSRLRRCSRSTASLPRSRPAPLGGFATQLWPLCCAKENGVYKF